MDNSKSVRFSFGLIFVGLMCLIFQTIDVGENLILPLLGIGFLGWSILSRNKGLLVPGGVLSGIGLGIIFSESAWAIQLEGYADGALFFVGFAAGWFAITALSTFFFSDFQWWPLIPGGIMLLLGTGLLTDGFLLEMLGQIGRYWPLILIVVGFATLFKRFSEDQQISYEKGAKI